MQRVQLEVMPRDLGDNKVKRNLSQLRQEGWIPGVLYGHGEPVAIAVNDRDLTKAMSTKAGRNALFTIKLGAENALGIVKEVQRHIISHKPIHVDFQRINVKEKIDVNVPVHSAGEAPGVKNDGGILELITREVRVRCLPDDIPASLDVDVSKLGLGQAIRLADLTPPKGVEFLTATDHILVNVVAPKVEEVAAPTAVEGAAAAAAEPEVIAKGKKEEEGAAAPAAAGAAPAAAKPAAEKKK